MDNNITFELTETYPMIKVYNLKNGVYTINDKSLGKSWLCNSLKKLYSFGYPVIGYDYYDFVAKNQLSQHIDTGLKLIAIDRYDMYNGELADEIIKLSEKSIVLIDCKTTLQIHCPRERATIKINRKTIEIWRGAV
jgi:hypothetical protein